MRAILPLLIPFIVAGTAWPASAPSCLDYKNFQHGVGLATDGRAISLAQDGSTLFVAHEDGGLLVVDASDPARLRPIGQHPTPGGAWTITRLGERILVGTSTETQFYDVTFPESPTLLSSWPRRLLQAAAAVGDVTYTVHYETGLHVYDLGFPTAPQEVHHTFWYGCTGLAARQSHAYVVGETGFRVLDVRDPRNPVLVRTLDLPGRGLLLHGEYLYLATDGVLKVLDLSTPDLPIIVGELELPLWLTGRIRAAGNRIYAMRGRWGFNVIDVSDPTAPHEIFASRPGWTSDVAVFGDIAVLALREVGLGALNVAAPTETPELATVPLASSRRIHVRSLYGFSVAGFYGLSSLSLTTPETAVELDRIFFEDDARDLEIVGNHALVATWSAGVASVDVSKPADLKVSATLELPGWASGIDTRGNTAYIAALNFGVHAVDVSDPELPHLRISTFTSGFARDVETRGDHVYAITEYAEVGLLEVLHAPSPDDLQLVASVPLERHPSCIEIDDAVAYIGLVPDDDGTSTVVTFDLAAGGEPQRLGNLNLPGRVEQLAADGALLYVAAGGHGLRVLDVADPTRPVVIGGQWPGGETMGVTHADGRVYAATQGRGLAIYPEHCYGSPPLLGPTDAAAPSSPPRTGLASAPDPFGDRTGIRFSLEEPSVAELVIFDVAGRRVRSWPGQPLPAGEHVRTWDGRNDAGRRLADGVYFVRLKSAGETRSHRVTLVRR